MMMLCLRLFLNDYMMRAVLQCTLLCAFFLVHTFSAQTQTTSIRGKTLDESGSPLPGVNVVIIEMKIGTSSKADGTFIFEHIPEGKYTIQFSMIGHETLSKSILVSSASPKDFLLITMQPAAIQMQSIDIIRNRFRQRQEDTRTSVQQLDPRETKILPGAAEDVMRSLQALPGVLAPNDFSSQLIIRGSGPDQNLVVMDEVEVFNPYRLYGAVSMFNPETVSDINLLTGGFPAKYGDRLSAVLDITNRKGRRENPIYGNVNTSLTNANIVLEGQTPLGIKGSWLISSRRTYYDLIVGPIARNAGLVSGDVAFPNFGDIQAKLEFGPFNGHTFLINGIASRDGVDVISGENRDSPDSVAVLNSTINNIISAGWYYAPTEKTLNKIVFSRYDNHGSTEFDGKFLDPVLNHDDYSGSQNDSLKALARLFGISINSSFKVNKYSLKDEITIEDGKHLFEAGIGYDYITADLIFNLNMSPELRRIIEANPRGSAIVESAVQSQMYSKARVYFQDRINLAENLYVQPGLRFDYYDIIAKAYFSPRINASYALDPVTTLRAAWGMYYQPPGYEKLIDQNQYFDFSKSNLKEIHAEKADHYILGIDRWLSSEWLAKSEVYFKKFDDLLVQKKAPGLSWIVAQISGTDPRKPSGWTSPYQIARDSLTTTPVNDSYGEAYGIEATIEKRNADSSNTFSGWISYALAWAQRYRDGYLIPFNYDQRHTLNLVGNYRVLHWLEVGAFWKIGSNFPTTEPIGVRPRIITENGTARIATDFKGNVILDIDWGDESRINQSRKPLYHRLDMRFTAYTEFWGMKWGFYIDVINIYNNKNVNQYRYFVKTDGSLGRKEINMFPLLPTIGFNARF